MNKFKTFVKNSDTITLALISIVFLIIGIAGLINKDSILENLALSYNAGEIINVAVTIVGLIIMGGCAIGVPIYSVYRWFRYKNTGKW